jgi:hypothetical protein
VFLPHANGGIGQLREVPETHVHPARELSMREFNEGDRVLCQGTEYTVVGLEKEREDGTKVYVLQADGFEDADPRDFPWQRGVKIAGAGALTPVVATPDLIPEDIMAQPMPELSNDAPERPDPWMKFDDDSGLGL